MFAQSITVPEAVRRVISSNRLYEQALELGIVNYTALAVRIKLEVEELMGTKANTNTIVVAIKRLSDSIERRRQAQESTTPSAAGGGMAKAKLSLTGSILDLDLEMDDDVVNTLNDFLRDTNKYNFFQTDKRFTVLAEDAEEIRDAIANVLTKFEGTLVEGLSKITIALSPNENDPYDILSVVSGILYSNQIPVRSVFFTGNEMVLVLSNKDAAKAYDLIRMKIQ